MTPARNGFVGFFAAAATLVSVSLLVAQAPPAAAPGAVKGAAKGKGRGPATPSGPAPHLPDGTPDFAGLWSGGGSNSGDITKGLKPGEEVVMQPWAEALMKTRKSQDDPQANCLPFGVPRGAPYPWRMVQTPTHKAATHIFILYEGNIHSYRQIFMNAKHPDDPDPTWYGHSIGHWEGETLVVDTVGFNDKFCSTIWAIRIPNSSTPSSVIRGPTSGPCTSRSPSTIREPTPSRSRPREPRGSSRPAMRSWNTFARRTTST